MDINKIKKESLKEISDSKNHDSLESVRVKYLGRAGILTEVLKSLKGLSLEEKKKIGPEANKLRGELEQKITERKEKLSGSENLKPIDITAPGEKIETGHLHPITQVREEIEDIFSSMGFSIAEGPQLEREFYNFDALNVPKDHPSREMQDTFWVKTEKDNKDERLGQLLMRTHTSPVQARYMESHTPPFRIIAPGLCFRNDASDQRHDFQFNQLEGLMVGEDVSLVNLKSILNNFMRRFFGKDVKTKWNPSFFPFVEPGMEILMGCSICDTKGCKTCGGVGWMEVIPCGMVHPNVFKAIGYNPKNWQGFAFGMGLDRLIMMKYRIPDIRLLYSGDLRVIQQF